MIAFLDSALWCLEEIGEDILTWWGKQLPAGRFEMRDESGTLDGKGQERKERGGVERANNSLESKQGRGDERLPSYLL